MSVVDEDATTELSFVGIGAPGKPAPFALTPGVGADELAELTTDESSVGINGGGLAAGDAGDGGDPASLWDDTEVDPPDAGGGEACGSAGVAEMLALSNAAC